MGPEKMCAPWTDGPASEALPGRVPVAPATRIRPAPSRPASCPARVTLSGLTRAVPQCQSLG